jgi:hypothetical protein
MWLILLLLLLFFLNILIEEVGKPSKLASIL